MIADLPLPEPEDADDERLLRALERDGWICRGVSPSTGDPAGTPRFAYTAGLERTWGHPELIILGVDWPDSYGILEAAVGQVRDGTTFVAGEQRYGGIVGGRDVAFVEVAHAHRWMNMTYTAWLHRKEEFRALQVVWPDDKGRFPWDADYEQIPTLEQELLSEDLGELERAAEAGDVAAAKRLGEVWWRYDALEASKRFYRMAAEAGDAEARRRLDELA